MKYILVLVVVYIAFSLWQHRRREEIRAKAPPPRRRIPAPQAMLRCAHCGMHLPATEVVAGADGKPYCSEAHKQRAQA